MQIPADILERIQAWLNTRDGAPCQLTGVTPLAGGCIHHAYQISTTRGAYFLKWNKRGEADNYRAEQRGLELLARHRAGFAATPLTTGQTEVHSFLMLEFIEEAKPSGEFWEEFGRQLAALHRNSNPYFGLDHDNFIGRLPQNNRPSPDYVRFFIESRLRPQVRLARDGGWIDENKSKSFERLYHRLPDLIPPEPPALLHGDLWQGNFLCTRENMPVLIDPAVYYGHREAEIAFTGLFGGFDPTFYESYHQAFPLTPGWRSRQDLFNLYPLLVHLNLFGKSYLAAITSILHRYSGKV